MDRYINTLISTVFFRDFTKEDLKQVFEELKFEIKKYGKGEIIHLQNDKCNYIDFIISGQIMIQNIDENGNAFTITVFKEGDIIGANLIFSNRNIYPMSVIATSESKIIHMKKDSVLELCNLSKSFMLVLLTSISSNTLILTDKINAMAMKTIREALIDLLKFEYFIQKSNVIKFNMSKKELSERMGVRRSSLGRELNKMRKDGLIEFDSSTITIININGITNENNEKSTNVTNV